MQLQLSICLSIYLFIYLPFCLFIYLPIYLSIYLSIYLQVWKRSYSARLPQFLNLTPYNYCTTPHYIQELWVMWPLQPLQPPQKAQLQPPFGPSVDSLCHPSITTTHQPCFHDLFRDHRLERYQKIRVREKNATIQLAALLQEHQTWRVIVQPFNPGVIEDQWTLVTRPAAVGFGVLSMSEAVSRSKRQTRDITCENW